MYLDSFTFDRNNCTGEHRLQKNRTRDFRRFRKLLDLALENFAMLYISREPINTKFVYRTNVLTILIVLLVVALLQLLPVLYSP